MEIDLICGHVMSSSHWEGAIYKLGFYGIGIIALQEGAIACLKPTYFANKGLSNSYIIIFFNVQKESLENICIRISYESGIFINNEIWLSHIKPIPNYV